MILRSLLCKKVVSKLVWKGSAEKYGTAFFMFSRNISAKAESSKNESKERTASDMSVSKPASSLPSTSAAEKVKQAGKDAFWTGIVIAGIAVTGLMGFVILRELFSSTSPSGVYSEAFKRCKKDPRVQSILGSPMKAYGELSSLRGRRRHVQSAQFTDGQAQVIQLVFYVSGPFSAATVYVEKDVTNSSYRVLRFETDDGKENFSLLDDPVKSRPSTIFS
ncbi:mitochondrial import inner membrane translocase subunit Tim21-like [Paramacrobiotus metropolitanus]|uniref:mitochondrial import inner membrane translocase subunit Tim21-like n=1 Tax=Paramacrobiotus metropolitanus TaxID=2943436 RepID=UPI002445658C|nr:mitochondrial import inner membrane translocase subunit Tim21-like [Paramacrobiotus metropolitanus]